MKVILTTIVSDVDNIVKLEQYDYSYFALDKNGTVWAWGSDNSYGQLGIGTTTGTTTPTEVSIQNVRSILPNNYTLFLTASGDLYMAGGYETRYTTPQKILSDCTEIRGCYSSLSVAELSDGSQYEVDGYNGTTSLVTGTYASGKYYGGGYSIVDGEIYYCREKVSKISDVKSLWFNTYDSTTYFALKNDGTLWGKGSNTYSRLTMLAGGSESEFVPI